LNFFASAPVNVNVNEQFSRVRNLF
jgi:hypothetical protein